MSHAVVWVGRGQGALEIRQLRLAHARGVESWSPVGVAGGVGGAGLGDGSGGSGGDGQGGPEALIDRPAEAARWVREALGRVPGTPALIVCLDLDGARCGWMTLPGAQPRLVRAAVEAARAGVGGGGAGGAGGGGGGGGAVGITEADPSEGLAWLEDRDPGVDVSVQALGEPMGLSPGRASDPPGSAGVGLHRLGLLACPDLAVRAFLDELDLLGIAVERVVTQWHAVSEAWDQGERPGGGAASGPPEAEPAREIVAEQGSGQVMAAVLIEPGGRLSWSWSSRGTVVAAGSMRLPVERTGYGGLRLSEAPAEAGRGSAEPVPGVLVNESHAGRLVAEWLAWSAQLGAAPGRVVIVGDGRSVVAPAVTQDQTTGLGWLAHRLGLAWPGAEVSAIDEPDPLGASLVRLCGALNDTAPRGQAPPAWRSAHELTTRPGRATRGLYRWAGLAVWCVALLVAAVGVSIGRGIGGLRERLESAERESAQTIERAGALVRLDPTDPDPVGLLQSRVAELRRARAGLVPEPPIMTELDRVLAVLGDKGALLVELSFGTNSSVVLQAPDAETGPRILDELDQLRALQPAGRRSINWSAQGAGSGATTGGQGRAAVRPGFRLYRIVGQWQAAPGAAGGGGAP